MTNLGHPGWSPDDEQSRQGRHRARHAGAAPDPYADDGYGRRDPARDGGYFDDGYTVSDSYGASEGYAVRDGRRMREDAVPPLQDPRGKREPAGKRKPAGRRERGRARAERSRPDDAVPRTGPPPRTGSPPEQPPPAPAGAPPGSRSASASGSVEPPAKKRAGRNLPAALAVGVTLGAAVIASLFVWRPAFFGVVVVAVGIATWEMSRAVRATGAQPPLTPLLVGGAVMTGLAWYSGPSALVIGLLLTVLATMVWRLADGPAGYHRDTGAATLIAVYIPFLAGFAAMLASPNDGAVRVIITLGAVVVSDTAGYVTGVFLGKRPLAPTVSPKKSWEGVAGSLVATAFAGAAAMPLLLDVAWWWGLLFGFAVSAAAVLGDLAESLLKRDLGVKDMSGLLPGHGGLMDRLDSILLAAPTAYVLLSVLAPPTG